MQRGSAESRKNGKRRTDDLDLVRAEIERVDRSLVELIAERVRLGRRAAVSKAAAGLPLLDPGQEAAVIRRVAEWSRETDLPTETVRDIFWTLVALTRQAQDR